MTALQQSAGNQAVAGLVGAGAGGLQRAPNTKSGAQPPARTPAGGSGAGSQSADASVKDAEARLAGARTGRKAAEAQLAAVMKPAPGGQPDLDLWVRQAEPALHLADARLAEARVVRELADARVAAAQATGVDLPRLGREAAEARAREGDAEVAVGRARTQLVRAKRVAEGLAAMRSAFARRTAGTRGGSSGALQGPRRPGGGHGTAAGQPAGSSTGPTQPARPDLPTDEDLDASFDALEAGRGSQPATFHRIPAAGLRDARMSGERGSEIDVANVSGVTVHEGAFPLDGGAPAATLKGPAPPETWLLDPARANLTDPALIVDEQFRPNRSKRDYDVRNVQVAAGPAGDRISTPTGPTFGDDRVVGGARGATLDPSSATWTPGEQPHERPHNPLGQDAPFGQRTAAEWTAWEQTHGPLTETERYALWFYSDDLSGHINPALRGQRPGEFVTDPVALKAAASDLDRAMRPVPFDTVVHRKASLADFSDLGVTDPAQLAGMAGKSYAHAGYTSTAVEPGHWSGDIDIVIQVPKGTRGRYLGGDSAAAQPTNPVRPAAGAPTASMPSEMEFLVERGTSFRIEKAEYDQTSGRWRVEVRVAEQGVKAAPLTNPVPLPGSPAGPGTPAVRGGSHPPTAAQPAGPAATAAGPSGAPASAGTPGPAAAAQDIRARRVAEGAAEMGRRAAARAERMKVEPIDDPEIAARMFIEGQGAKRGNLPMSRKLYERRWRDVHHQLTDPPAAGWRNADGTVTVDASNPTVRAAVERLAKERKAGTTAATGAPAGGAAHQPHPATPVPAGKPDPADETKQPTAPTQPPAPASDATSGGDPATPPRNVQTDVDFNLNEAKLTVSAGRPDVPAESGGPDVQKIAPKVAVNVSPKEVGANVEVMRPTQGGTRHGATAGGSYEFATGNTQASLGYKLATKGGHGATFALTGGNSVTVDDPEEVQEGVWVVSYVISDSSGVAGGVTAKAGAVEFGVGASETNARLKTGARKFNSESEALKFKKNIREELGGESALAPYFPPTTAAGALMIPPGESRGVGVSDTTAGSLSAGAASGSLAKSGYKSSTRLLSVYHHVGNTVQVTTTVSTESGSAWTAGGLGLSNESGGSESSLYAVTFEFDLGKLPDRQAFERFCARPLPPAGRKPHSLRRLTSQEDHDKYSLAGGNSGFGGSTSQERVVDAQGAHDTYTGTQTEDHTPGLILGLFEDEKHASAEIVSRLENGRESGFAARMKVSGESGDFNRRQFQRIFDDATFSGDAEASGKWTLTADIPRDAVHRLEQSSSKFRNARTQDEKLRIYSQLAKENGARMIGGQVGLTSLAWNLELKGDENFPGARGRAKLDDQRRRLAEQLKARPDTAYAVAREAGETLNQLDKRYRNVANKKKYTDLPDGLRNEQLQVIRQHRSDFIALRQRALGVGGWSDPNEKLEDVERRATTPGGYDRVEEAVRERTRLQDSVRLSDDAIRTTHDAIVKATRAIADVRTAPGDLLFHADVDKQTMESTITSVENLLGEAFALNREQMRLEQEIKVLREKWDRELDPARRLDAMRPLEQKLRARRSVLAEQLGKVMEVGRILYPVAKVRAMQKRPAFWQSVSAPRAETPEPVSMAL